MALAVEVAELLEIFQIADRRTIERNPLFRQQVFIPNEDDDIKTADILQIA
jgi:hypothetical protein